MTSEASELVRALAIASEVIGTDLSKGAATVIAKELRRFPHEKVIEALRRCMLEVRSRLTLAEIVARIDDGRPGVEEAFNMIPEKEDATVVWTEEMATAWGASRRALEDGDRIAARMAFKEVYTRELMAARIAGKPPKWTVSPGTDPVQRSAVVQDAVDRGLLSGKSEAVRAYLPAPDTRAEDDRATGRFRQLRELIGERK